MSEPMSAPGNGLRLSGPGGLSLVATGREVILVLLLLAVAVLLYRGFEVSAAQHTAIQRSQNELACVLALPQEVRPDAIMDPLGSCHYVTTVYRWTGGRPR